VITLPHLSLKSIFCTKCKYASKYAGYQDSSHICTTLGSENSRAVIGIDFKVVKKQGQEWKEEYKIICDCPGSQASKCGILELKCGLSDEV